MNLRFLSLPCFLSFSFSGDLIFSAQLIFPLTRPSGGLIFSPVLFRMLPAGAQKNRQDVRAHAVTRHSFSKSPKTCPRYRGFSRHSAPSPGITAGRSGTAIHIGRCLSFLDLKGSTGDKHKLFFEKVSSTERPKRRRRYHHFTLSSVHYII